jgi:hypothetical protein
LLLAITLLFVGQAAAVDENQSMSQNVYDKVKTVLSKVGDGAKAFPNMVIDSLRPEDEGEWIAPDEIQFKSAPEEKSVSKCALFCPEISPYLAPYKYYIYGTGVATAVSIGGYFLWNMQSKDTKKTEEKPAQ